MKKTVSIILSTLFCATGAMANTKPHIVYILADDMGHGDVQALRAECKFPTPHLNRLANEGMAFTQAYSGSAICTPTRYGIMTGRYCWRDGVGLASGYTGPEIEGVPTVAEFLRGQGYRTRMVGKWHLGGQWTGVDGAPVKERKPKPGTVDFSHGITGGPVDRGFESWFGIIASLDMPPYVYFRDRTPVAIPTKLVPAKSPFGNRAGLADPDLSPYTVLGDITTESIKVIREHNPKESLFLYMPLNAPHSPVVPSPEWQGRSKIDEHADFRMEVDHSVGRILKALEEKGILDDTLVIFTADNGSASFAVTSMLKEGGHDSSDGRRGWKATWFEGGHRVPFIVRWPEGLKGRGRKDAGMITLEDFFATVADILDQPLPAEAGDSVSFLPQLQGQSQDKSQREIIMSSLSNKLVLRHKQWKLICVGEEELVGRVEKKRESKGKAPNPNAAWHEQVSLYNLEDDVAETTNLAQQNPAIVAQIAKRAVAAILDGRTNRGPARPDSCKQPQIELLKKLSTLD
ncbi:sulfatase family protein [Pontiella sulfatireligans]|uniref:Arylsulfatase n=1 Tax=Pontiella sulfatireligans TaxID=2750658 RepID=A0A6C2UEK6_9BACT|nr:arylsulfatase [Pontiella sulfatireligans]SPS74205.1 sulfatase S1_15 [Kiritimatiellales bacterium]VGO18610.1 Arylsulfatase [Pontiella sulfatireligans]